MPYIEKDALNNSDAPETGAFLIPAHDHAPGDVKTFVATPRYDPSLMERFRSLFKSELKPGQFITRAKDGLRYMFIITSNSYEDRDDETITSKALAEYEASCYPGEGLFRCDNPLLWWHDDDVPMGEIVAVNFSAPFLVEVAKELPSPTARVLWDYAEQNGDAAGASHRFGYREEDRKPDGSFTHIFKQESSYLPERSLAANLMTYAGVIDKTMSTSQSDARLNEIFAQATGGKIKDAAAKIHAKSGELEKELAALGIAHKAKAGNPAEPAQDAEAQDVAVDNTMPVADEQKAPTLPADFMKKLEQLEAIYQMCMALVDAQNSMVEGMDTMQESELAMAKELKALRDEKAAQKAYTDTLESRVKMLESRLNLTQRRASQDVETDPEKVKQAIDESVSALKDSELVDSMFGKVKPPIKYT